jgi:hypothetical protein
MPEGVSESESIGEQFRSIVEAVVAPVLHEQRSGRYVEIDYNHRTSQAQRSIEFLGDTITFTKHVGRTSLASAGLLDFVPMHSIEIVSSTSPEGETLFGLRDNGRIARSHLVYTELLLASVVRDLDDEESQAIVDYARAPHINVARRAIALRLLPSEKRRIRDHVRRDRQTSEVLHAGFREIDQARQQSLRTASRHILH